MRLDHVPLALNVFIQRQEPVEIVQNLIVVNPFGGLVFPHEDKKGSSPKSVGNFARFFQLEIYIRGFSKA
jgi:hypothetical protein